MVVLGFQIGLRGLSNLTFNYITVVDGILAYRAYRAVGLFLL
jgi:hypothetical protein